MRLRSARHGLHVALGCLYMAVVAAIEAAAQGTTPADPVVRFGPDVWFVIAGVLITVGINLEQLRRVRADVKDLRSAVSEATHEGAAYRDEVKRDLMRFRLEESHDLARITRRLDQLENNFAVLLARRMARDAAPPEDD